MCLCVCVMCVDKKETIKRLKHNIKTSLNCCRRMTHSYIAYNMLLLCNNQIFCNLKRNKNKRNDLIKQLNNMTYERNEVNKCQ